jgi:hypothetical protein
MGATCLLRIALDPVLRPKVIRNPAAAFPAEARGERGIIIAAKSAPPPQPVEEET